MGANVVLSIAEIIIDIIEGVDDNCVGNAILKIYCEIKF